MQKRVRLVIIMCWKIYEIWNIYYVLKIYEIIGNILNFHSENILENLTFISQVIFHKEHNIVVSKMPLVTIVC